MKIRNRVFGLLVLSIATGAFPKESDASCWFSNECVGGTTEETVIWTGCRNDMDCMIGERCNVATGVCELPKGATGSYTPPATTPPETPKTEEPLGCLCIDTDPCTEDQGTMVAGRCTCKHNAIPNCNAAVPPAAAPSPESPGEPTFTDLPPLPIPPVGPGDPVTPEFPVPPLNFPANPPAAAPEAPAAEQENFGRPLREDEPFAPKAPDGGEAPSGDDADCRDGIIVLGKCEPKDFVHIEGGGGEGCSLQGAAEGSSNTGIFLVIALGLLALTLKRTKRALGFLSLTVLIGLSGCEYYSVLPPAVGAGQKDIAGSGDTEIEVAAPLTDSADADSIILPSGAATKPAVIAPAVISPATQQAADLPSVVSTLPATGAANVLTTIAAVQVEFDRPMNPGTVRMGFFGPGYFGLIAPVGVPDSRNKVFSWNFTQALDPDTEYTVIIPEGAEDQSGNKYPGAYQWTFRTGAARGFQRVQLPAEGVSLREYYRIDGSGGNGGAASEVLCPEGEAMVGLKLLATGAIDKIMDFACHDINRLTDAAKKHWITVDPAPPAGTADDVTIHEASAGEVFVGFSSKTVEKDDSLVVGEFVPSFAKVAKDRIDASSVRQSGIVSGAGSGDAWSSQLCPTGYAQVGLRIRSGGYLDRLGSVCRRVAPASEPRALASGLASISAHEGYEFGIVEYDWSPESNGSGENSQPVLNGSGVQRMECQPGYAMTNLFVYTSERIEGFYGGVCSRPQGDQIPFAFEVGTAIESKHHVQAVSSADVGNYLAGWHHKRSEYDGSGNNDIVMVAELQMLQSSFDRYGFPVNAFAPVGALMGWGTNWGDADDNYTDWITETCPAGFVLSGLKLKMEENRPRGMGGVCRRMIPASQEPGYGEKNPQP